MHRVNASADRTLPNSRSGCRCDRRAGRCGNRRHTFRCRPGESRILGAAALRHRFLLPVAAGARRWWISFRTQRRRSSRAARHIAVRRRHCAAELRFANSFVWPGRADFRLPSFADDAVRSRARTRAAVAAQGRGRFSYHSWRGARARRTRARRRKRHVVGGGSGVPQRCRRGDLQCALSSLFAEIFGASRRRFRDAGLRRFLAVLAAAEGFFHTPLRITPAGWLAVGFIGVSSGVGYWLWLWALSNATPTRVTVFLSLSPITAAILGLLLLGEMLSLLLLAGLGAVMAGLWLAHRD